VKLLEIQSSPRGESSDSITLTKSFIEACKSDNDSIVVDTLNVWHERLPEFDYEAIGAKYKAVKHETMTEAESNVWVSNVWERIQSLIQRFQNADRIVLGTPMWNFGLPYKLKQLIDLVAQRNYLFSYDGKQYGPLLNVERAVAVYTSGSRYLKALLYRGCIIVTIGLPDPDQLFIHPYICMPDVPRSSPKENLRASQSNTYLSPGSLFNPRHKTNRTIFYADEILARHR